jgi:hypothetical protein
MRHQYTWRRRDLEWRPIKYLTNKDLEAAGVGLPRSSDSRMISRTRWAQSARNDRKPRCRYKRGTADPPTSARSSEAHDLTQAPEAHSRRTNETRFLLTSGKKQAQGKLDLVRRLNLVERRMRLQSTSATRDRRLMAPRWSTDSDCRASRARCPPVPVRRRTHRPAYWSPALRSAARGG